MAISVYMLREIVEIDEARCDGCGDCIPSCAEGAIQLVNGKARLVGDVLCDGLGACLGECPQGALRVVKREALAFDARAVESHLDGLQAPAPPARPVPGGSLPVTPAAFAPRRAMLAVMQAPVATGGGCPGSRSREFGAAAPASPAAGPVAAAGPAAAASPSSPPRPSELTHWPIQLELVATRAPWLAGADLLVAADCVPFAYADFHRDFLAGRRVVVGCPKLDDNRAHVDKLAELFRAATPRSVTVVKMEVPCCGGIAWAVQEALRLSGRDIPYVEATIGLQGDRRS